MRQGMRPSPKPVLRCVCVCVYARARARTNLPPADLPHRRQGSQVSASVALHVCRRAASVASFAALAARLQRAERGIQRLRQRRQARPAPPRGGGGICFPWAPRGEKAPRSSGVGEVVFEGGWSGGSTGGCGALRLVPRLQLLQVPALP